MRLVIALALASLLGGCATESLDPDDKAFFYAGWWNPEKGAAARLVEGELKREATPAARR